MKSLSRYEVTDKTRFTDSWIWLALLLIAGFIVWRTVSSLAALIIALVGIIIIGLIYRSSKQHIGNTIEINDQAMIFQDEDQQSCIAFNEIKKVKPIVFYPCWVARPLLLKPLPVKSVGCNRIIIIMGKNYGRN